MSRRKTWRCFFCDDVFTNKRDAAEHFGADETEAGSLVACKIKGHEHNLLRVIRQQEADIIRCAQGDTEIARAMESMEMEHADALRVAEETGYGRGVRDMQKIAVQQIGKELVV